MSEAAPKTKTPSWSPTMAQAKSDSHLTPRPFPMPVNNVPLVQASQDLTGYRKPQSGDMIDNVRRYQQTGTSSPPTAPTATSARQLIAPAPQSFGLSIQPKLTIGEPGDRYEQEADKVASEVVQRLDAESSSSSAGKSVQRMRLSAPRNTTTMSQPAAMGEPKLWQQVQRQESQLVGEATRELKVLPSITLSRWPEARAELKVNTQAPPLIYRYQGEAPRELQAPRNPPFWSQPGGFGESKFKHLVQRQDDQYGVLQAKPEITALQRQEEPDEELQAKPSISDLQMSPLSPEVQREAMAEEEDLLAKSNLQRAIAVGEASKDLESAINSARGSGQPLDAGLQQSMGQAMGADFSGVKVHTDAQADQLNQSIQAKAFTTGQDVFFRQGAYQPGSRGGQELIAHELTHVVQQSSSGATRAPQLHPATETPSALRRDHLIQEQVVQCKIPPTTVNWVPAQKTDSQNQLTFTYPVEMEAIVSQDPGRYQGSGPDGKAAWWPYFQKRHKVMSQGKIYWVQGHLLNDNLHGPGEPQNLVPISNATNTNMETKGERIAKNHVKDGGVIRYKVKANWDQDPNTTLQNWGPYDATTDKGLLPGECTAPTSLSWEVWSMKETTPDQWQDDQQLNPPETQWYNTFPIGQ